MFRKAIRDFLLLVTHFVPEGACQARI